MLFSLLRSTGGEDSAKQEQLPKDEMADESQMDAEWMAAKTKLDDGDDYDLRRLQRKYVATFPPTREKCQDG